MEEEREIETIHPENKKEKKKNFIKIISGIFVALVIIFLVVLKLSTPTFPLSTVIIIGSVLIFAGIIAFFSSNIYNFFFNKEKEEKDEDKVPEAIGLEELKEIVEDTMSNRIYENHVKQYLDIAARNVGGNLIYNFKIIPLYKIQGKKECYIIINANYPQRAPTVMFEPNPAILTRAVNIMSSNPETEPNIVKRRTINPILGTEQYSEERTHPVKPLPKPKEEED